VKWPEKEKEIETFAAGYRTDDLGEKNGTNGLENAVIAQEVLGLDRRKWEFGIPPEKRGGKKTETLCKELLDSLLVGALEKVPEKK